MKKSSVIFIALILANFLLASCQKAKEPEKKEVQQTQEGVKQSETSQKKKEKPARCQELWNKRPKFSKMDKYYLWTECRMPWADTPGEFADVIQWWKDEDGYEDVMLDNFSYRIKQPSDFFWIRNRIREPLKNLALNSKYPTLRKKAIINLYDIDNKKFIPFFKELIKKEVEERGVTDKNRQTIGILGGYLSEQGEYEYAFPFLMKAKLFKTSSKQNDRRAIPYMYEALKNDDPCYVVLTAWDLVEMGEKNDKVYNAVVKLLEGTQKKAKDFAGCRANAVQVLGKLKNRKAIPLLNKLLQEDFSDAYGKKLIHETITKIEGRANEQ